MKTLPTKKLASLVDNVYGSANAAAIAWDIPTSTLLRFMEQGIEAPVPMRIMAKTGLKFEDVALNEEE
jgi:hypothetical protein